MIDGLYLQHLTVYTLGYIVQLFVLDPQMDALDGLFGMVKGTVSQVDESV